MTRNEWIAQTWSRNLVVTTLGFIEQEADELVERGILEADIEVKKTSNSVVPEPKIGIHHLLTTINNTIESALYDPNTKHWYMPDSQYLSLQKVYKALIEINKEQ